MAWNGGLALTLWCAVFAVRSTYSTGRRQLTSEAVAGVLGGLALTYRPDLILAVAAIIVWLLATKRRAWRATGIGMVVGLVPLWVHLAIAGPRAAWQGMVVDPVVHLRAGRELPRPPSWDRLDGALQAIAESQPPWWHLPHLPRIAGDLPVVLRDARRHGRARRRGGLATPSWLARRPGHGAPRRHPRQRRDPPAGAATAGFDAPHVGDVRVVAVRRHRRHRGRPAAAADAVDAPSRGRRRRLHPRADVHVDGAVHVPLLPAPHPRQLRLGAVDVRGQPRRPQLLLRGAARRSRQPAARRRPRRARRPRRPAVRRTDGPVAHVVQRRRLLLAVPGDGAGDLLHRDGPRPRQRRRLAARRRPRLRRLRRAHLVLGRLERAQRLDGLRLTRAQRGARQALLPVPRTTRTASSACTTAAADARRVREASVHPSVDRAVDQAMLAQLRHCRLEQQTLGSDHRGRRRQSAAGR